jgi:predicted O-methyltransferase YrrM
VVLGKARGLSTQQLDQLATAMLSKCCDDSWPREQAAYRWADFHQLRADLHANYFVPSTSITVLASRVLWGISVVVQPRTVVGVGTFYGNALSWLLGPGFSPTAQYEGARAVALDINAVAAQGFQSNAESIGLRVDSRHADGLSWLRESDEPIDLLYLDLDTPDNGKWGYIECLAAARDKLRPGAIIVAHDVFEQKFAAEMSQFIEILGREATWVAKIATDTYGVGVAQL